MQGLKHIVARRHRTGSPALKNPIATRSRQTYLKLYCLPCGSLDAGGSKNILRNSEHNQMDDSWFNQESKEWDFHNVAGDLVEFLSDQHLRFFKMLIF